MLPPAAVEAQPLFQRLSQLKAAPIISIHLWFNRTISRKLFVGMLDTHVQWFFNKSAILGMSRNDSGRYISLVISGAHNFIEWQDKRLLAMAMEELHRIFPNSTKAILLRSLIIKEHQATLSPEIGSDHLRP